MRAFKGFEKRSDGKLWCIDFQYEVGKTYEHKGNIRLCCRGFHACHELHQVWQFYPNDGFNVFYEVECGGEIIESKEGDGKFVCSEIRLVKEVDVSNVAKFDYAGYFSEGFAWVKLKNEYNFINTEGKLLSNRWFDYASYFHEGFARVMLDGKWKRINKKGEIF